MQIDYIILCSTSTIKIMDQYYRLQMKCGRTRIFIHAMIILELDGCRFFLFLHFSHFFLSSALFFSSLNFEFQLVLILDLCVEWLSFYMACTCNRMMSHLHFHSKQFINCCFLVVAVYFILILLLLVFLLFSSVRPVTYSLRI